MRNIPAYNSFTNVREAASTRINKKGESKTKKLKEALEHGLADLTSKDVSQHIFLPCRNESLNLQNTQTL